MMAKGMGIPVLKFEFKEDEVSKMCCVVTIEGLLSAALLG